MGEGYAAIYTGEGGLPVVGVGAVRRLIVLAL
jgi:hypothetical protein